MVCLGDLLEVSMPTLLTILLVDDDENFSSIIAETLRAEGYDVITAHSGIHGYSKYLRQKADVVLTDIQMPELDGLEMIHHIRGIDPDVKAIYASGAVSEYRAALEAEGREHGAVVLSKPFSKGDLLKSLVEISGGGAPASSPSH
jgi:CheY-like chemotaxis protein